MTLPDEKQLRLSEDAVLHMRRILEEFSYVCDDGISLGSTRQRLHQLLAEFFDTFGSHVFRRPAYVTAYVGKTTALLPGRTRYHRNAEGCSARSVGTPHSRRACDVFPYKQEGPSGTVASSMCAARW